MVIELTMAYPAGDFQILGIDLVFKIVDMLPTSSVANMLLLNTWFYEEIGRQAVFAAEIRDDGRRASVTTDHPAGLPRIFNWPMHAIKDVSFDDNLHFITDQARLQRESKKDMTYWVVYIERLMDSGGLSVVVSAVTEAFCSHRPNAWLRAHAIDNINHCLPLFKNLSKEHSDRLFFEVGKNAVYCVMFNKLITRLEIAAKGSVALGVMMSTLMSQQEKDCIFRRTINSGIGSMLCPDEMTVSLIDFLERVALLNTMQLNKEGPTGEERFAYMKHYFALVASAAEDLGIKERMHMTLRNKLYCSEGLLDLFNM